MENVESGGSVTVKQAAEILNISVRTMYNKLNRHEISYTDYDIKRISLEEIEAYQNAHYYKKALFQLKRLIKERIRSI